MKPTFNREKEFTKDFTYGNWGEGVMIRFIENYFLTKDKFVSYWYSIDDVPNIKKNQLKNWDLKFGTYLFTDRINYTGQFEVEVKTDMYEINTNNLIFEKSCNNKKSGVFATKAKYFLYFLPLFTTNNIYLIQSHKLIEILNKFNTHLTSGGDIGSTTFMYKINRSEFDDVFKASGGKIITYDEYKIPEAFQKEQFTNKDRIVYSSESFKKYDDDDLL